jgi:hypothetical protein
LLGRKYSKGFIVKATEQLMDHILLKALLHNIGVLIVSLAVASTKLILGLFLGSPLGKV